MLSFAGTIKSSATEPFLKQGVKMKWPDESQPFEGEKTARVAVSPLLPQQVFPHDPLLEAATPGTSHVQPSKAQGSPLDSARG